MNVIEKGARTAPHPEPPTAAVRSGAQRELRVLHLIPGLGLGGSERALADMLRLIDDRQIEFEVAVLARPAATPDWIAWSKPPVMLDHVGGVGNPRGTPRTVRRLKRIIAEFKPDILHTHRWPADIIGGLAILGSPVRHISHQQGTSPWFAEPGLRKSLRRIVTRFVYRRNRTEFVAVSEAVKQYISGSLGIDASRFRVIHNGVDVEAFGENQRRAEPTGIRPLVIGTTARFEPEKGLDLLVRAVARLSSAGRDVRLSLAGDGSQRANIQRLAESLGIADRVSLPGLVTEINAFYDELDVFVLPSLAAEGFSLSLVEAMAKGLPVVATRVGGAEEAIEDGVDGLIIAPREDKLLAALERLLVDRALRQRLADNAQRRARRQFSAQAMAGQVRAMYLESLPHA